MKKYFILITSILCFQGCTLNQNKTQESVLVKIRVLEAGTNEVTPVMVCITGTKDGKVRIPPSAHIMDSVSQTNVFYKGIEFSKDKNWIGPVRKMNGLGNNDDRSYVYDSLPSIPHCEDPFVYQTSGDFSITLSPGAWKISLEHGNEFIPVKEEFIISAKEKELTKTFILQRWIDLPKRGWYSGDVHVHHPTNKPEFKEFLLEYARAEDIHLVNVLEMGHHLGTEFKQEGFGENFRTCKGNICLVSGQEDPRSTFGHIIGLNISQMERDTSTYNYYDLVFKKLHLQQGAIVGYAHFSWNGCDLPRGFPWYITTGEIDFVELLQFSKINTLDYYDYLNLGFRITAAAGSDVPWGSTLGEVRTFVYTGNTFSADAWFEGLKSGHTFVSNGPALFLDADGALPGTEIIQEKGSITNLRVKAISHPGIGNIERMAVYNNDGLVAEKFNLGKSDSLQISLSHILEKSQWLAAVVYCDNGAVAHTTPVYYILDGKPTWDARKAPAIIEKQMDAIGLIEEETLNKENVDQGILDRLDMAKDVYRSILQQIDN
ncbi:MAG: CehA/McbA family metallohydrolase [Cyclobacteriaceae bacterium]|nr:CehA/McbA family metallohydrolase [Cyclobacteriaceae bacterium]